MPAHPAGSRLRITVTRLTFPAFGVTTQRVVEVAAVNPEIGGEQPLKRRWQFNQVPRRCFFQNGHGSDHRDTPASGFPACLTFVNQDQVGPEPFATHPSYACPDPRGRARGNRRPP